MSSSNRATSKGGKGVKADKSHKSEKSESGKGGGDKQQHRDGNSKNEDPSIKEKVKMLIDMTQRSEEEVCLALHESDYDVNGATNMLFESMAIGEWETRVKKKKSKQASAGGGKQDGSGGGKTDDSTAASLDWDDEGSFATGGGGPRDGDRRNKGSGPPRLHGGRGANDSGGRGWRGRERHENERNSEDGSGGEFRGGRGGRSMGASRGGGGRGRGGGRAGGRYPPRGNRNNTYNKPIETWDNSNTWDNNTAIIANHTAEESWDDFPGADEWSTEEYQGSLADTKVFTPSVQTGPEPLVVSEPPELQNQPPLDSQQLGPQQQPVQSQSPVPPMVGTLTAAQTQYFSQLQQNNDPLAKQYVPVSQPYQAQSYEKASPGVVSGSPSQYATSAAPTFQSPYNAVSGGVPTGYQQTYGTAAVAPDQHSSVVQQQSQQNTSQHQRTKTQRARVPPPSKIPSSAVEMPGDLNSSIGYLDVQFGGMDLIDGSSFEAGIDSKFVSAQQGNSKDAVASATTSTGLDLNGPGQNGANLDGYSHKSNAQGSISSALSQSLSNTDNIPQTTVDHLSNAYSGSSTRNSTAAPTTGAVAPSAVSLELTKQQQSEGHSSYAQPSSYNSYQSKANSGGYNSSSYNATQTTTASYVSNQAASYVNSQSGGGYNVSSNSYQNAYSTNSSYQSGSTTASATGFPSISQANTYPSNTQSYPQNTNQSVYGTNTGLSNSSSYGNSTSQYNSYGSSGGQHKLSKDGTYDTSNTTSSAQTTTSVTSSASLSLSQTTTGGSKTSTTLAKNSNSIVSNIPPGVTPVMSTPYIMGQVPYFQQPVYSYEDMQLLQQRLPHMTTPYYDMSYQTTPTTLAAVRDAAALGSVGYTIGGDARFAAAAAAAAAAAGRTDNNASPSPSSSLSVGGQSGLSSSQGQQQAAAAAAAAQQQPMLAGAAPPPPYFFAATAFNTLAPNYQFGAMYTQLPTATNAHGSSNSTQYPKPASYGSGYGGYDALGQTAQDYAKGGYVGTAAQAQKSSGANTTSAGSSTGGANDLSTMYAKSHTALGKVNSYEKQGFHSGTPPPFTGTMHGSQSGGMAPSGTGYAPQVYIPTMAPHQQHHSTHLMQQPLHQDSSNTGGQRSQASNQTKGGAKQPYQTSYWNQA